ncbi:MAG: hydrolase [Alphaproteobacteria bacterium]|nr:hydrolase [Alphaproteobacteria bacterium]MBF0251131.1 hydrolase [Alphaproteobacteria bacterium]
MLIDADNSCLVVIDVQEKLNPVMFDPARAPAGAAKLLEGAGILGVPALLTEQYPQGLGPSVDGLKSLMPLGCPMVKSSFSCFADPAFSTRFTAYGKQQAVLCGIEAHVCVLQTALDLIRHDHDVFVVEDATASRTAENLRAGLERIRHAGGHVVTVEMVLFEWLRRSDVPGFRDVTRLIK